MEKNQLNQLTRLRIEIVPLGQEAHRRVYRIGLDANKQDIAKSVALLKTHGEQLFCDAIVETIVTQDNPDTSDKPWVEVAYKPGVTDNVGKTAEAALKLIGIQAQVYASNLYPVSASYAMPEANPLIQKITHYSNLTAERFTQVDLPLVILDTQDKPPVDYINLNITDDELLALNQARCLALQLNELHVIRDYYAAKQTPITDVELEILAQTWSEHCKHKIFGADISYTEDLSSQNNTPSDQMKALGNLQINSLYKTYIKNATKKIEHDFNIDWLKSVFSDNAGIVRFDDGIDLCIKVETHNSPSALDPYGGALTGILGVNRDILGTGMGALPLANTNVFCVGPYHIADTVDYNLMPAGLMAPHKILHGIHKGVEDGGNKSGIPTVNGAMCFDIDYCGKPLVYCGTLGVMPQQLTSGKDAYKKYHTPGDRVVIIGGRVGADGIHGATFSSMELDDNAPVSAVQIGDPITQKRVMDFLIEARDLELYSGITDNGAGGLSSSIGEMAEFTGGACIDLALCLFKYPGLTPWEIMISESQERMSLAVPPASVDALFALAARRGVEIINIGEFTDNGQFEVYYGQQQVACLDLNFMHHGLPPMALNAYWDGPRLTQTSWLSLPAKAPTPSIPQAIKTLLQDSNICSKKYWVEQYDQEVKGAAIVRPFVGKEAKTPADSGVIGLANYGGQDNSAVAVGCGINPYLSDYDPYLMALYAVDEAVRNIIAQGADPDHICLLDNFCWPDPVATPQNPDGQYKLGQLVRCNQGLYDITTCYGMPLVSGKDSMKNDFRGKNNAGDALSISIKPTLLVTSMGKVDSRHYVTSVIPNADQALYCVHSPATQTNNESLLLSRYGHYFAHEDTDIPLPDLQQNLNLYRLVHKAITQNLVSSCHDISEGGLVVALLESLFAAQDTQGNPLGADIIALNHQQLFNEGLGRFVVSVPTAKITEFEALFSTDKQANYFTYLGKANNTGTLAIKDTCDLNIAEHACYWQGNWSLADETDHSPAEQTTSTRSQHHV